MDGVVVLCREPNIEDTDEYIDTWQEPLSHQTVTTTPPVKSGCRMPPRLTRDEFARYQWHVHGTNFHHRFVAFILS